MSKEDKGVLHSINDLLRKDYRGVNIAVYALATAGLAVAIHKIRPVSKFSKAGKVPSHFFRDHIPLQGVYAGVQHSPVRILVNHRAPVYLPLWHSSKPPIPVKLWGVDIVSGNAINWLECVAKGQKVTLKPIARDKDDLVSTVTLHLSRPQVKTDETVDVGKRLVELGFAKSSVPKAIEKKSIESQLAPALLSAESYAKSYRNGIWLNLLPPIPFYVVYWRNASKVATELFILTSKQLYQLTLFILKSAFAGAKKLALIRFKKPVQTT